MAARGFAAAQGQDWLPVVLRDVAFQRPLILSYRTPKKVSLALTNLPTNGKGEAAFAIAAAGDGKSEQYCVGRVASASEKAEQVALDAELAQKETEVPIGPFYGELRKVGLEYGAAFSTVRELWRGKPGSGEAIGRIAALAHEEGADTHPFGLTVLLDGCFHVFGAALDTLASDGAPGAFVPATIRSATLRRELPRRSGAASP